LLVDAALDLLGSAQKVSPPPRICDVGTGSGCIAVTLLHERPLARGVGLDISEPALRVASRNSTRHGVQERLALIASDCFASLSEHAARFTMIVSNPPYVAAEAIAGLQREVREYEPHVALTPGTDGLDVIRRLLRDAPRFLDAGGHLLIEIGFDQHEAVRAMIDPQVWHLLDIHKDLQGIPRTVAMRKK
jgi:release factor glutamine methyltransferase